jgi:predicted RND superfamily exporter protein
VLKQYQQFQQRFGSDEIVVVAVTSGTGFESDEGVEQIADLTDRLFYVDGVASVTSISTVPATLLQARDRLLSDDGNTTVLLLQMGGGDDLESRRHAILADIGSAVREYELPARFAGYGVIYDSLNQASTEDSALLLGIAHLVMIVLLVTFFRRIGPAIVTLLAVGIATIWTMGLYAAMGQQINMVSMALPTLVLVISVADCVHLLRSVARQPQRDDREERIRRGIAEVIGPCALTSITTACGFLALTLSDLPVVQMLGFFGATGMLAAFVASLIFVTVGLSSPYAEVVVADSRFDAGAANLSAVAQQFPKTVIAGFALLAVVAAGGMARLQADTFSIRYLSDTHQARLDSDFIESQVGAYAPIDYVIHADNVLDGEILDGLQAWQQAASRIEGVDWSWSLLDAIDMRKNTVPSELPAEYIVGQVARMRLLSPAVANSMVAGQTELRVTFGAPMMSARSVQLLLRELDSIAKFPAHVSVQAAGYANLYTRIVERIVSSQITGFTLALGLILLTIFIATRSTARTLLAIPANLFPLAATLGLMGWCGIPLDVATATIATVILGLIVDDTLHILRPVSSSQSNLAACTRDAIRRSGGSLVMTSLVLCGGFLVMGLAEIRTVAWFGLLTSFAMASAIVTDLLLLPALATASSPRASQETLPETA